MYAKGFTLIELMVVVAIIAILSSLAVPSFSGMLRRQEVNGEANILFSLIYLARSEAIKRNSIVTICKSDDAEYCGGNWSDGWVVFQDNDKDGSRDTGEIKISSGTIGNNYQLSWNAFGSNNYIRFVENGFTLHQNGTFKLCPDDGDIKFARAVFITKTGRVRISKDSDADGLYEDSGGNPLTCA